MDKTAELPEMIIPKYIHDTRRAEEILDGIERFAEAKRPVPVEWIKEFKDLFKIYWS